jgi:SAM-dependent methyltransferase
MLTLVKRALKRLVPYYRRVRCPLCGAHEHEFLPRGIVPRANAFCQDCGSLERHRLVWHFFQRRTDLFDGKPKKMLHVAPEACLSRHFLRIPNLDYLTADLTSPTAMVQMDITDIQFADATFDVIYCSHVLEHVLNDREALREFRRVLRPTGWAALVVPIDGKVTFEDPKVTDPSERQRVFGDPTHVRLYGPDFRERLVESGLQVQAFRPTDCCDMADLARHGIPPTEDPIFLCTPASCAEAER